MAQEILFPVIQGHCSMMHPPEPTGGATDLSEVANGAQSLKNTSRSLQTLKQRPKFGIDSILSAAGIKSDIPQPSRGGRKLDPEMLSQAGIVTQFVPKLRPDPASASLGLESTMSRTRTLTCQTKGGSRTIEVSNITRP
ncbi:unnamed protein product [Protopolystoma xenopodis]|uniref:Uncharacterized protein n=1 Tax=Protopolystoma xenopodis TaxID=117903 RepID=A0A3S5AXL8_9PLAT|nr:unnamed protein product [Protopolystoma xenopodis]